MGKAGGARLEKDGANGGAPARAPETTKAEVLGDLARLGAAWMRHWLLEGRLGRGEEEGIKETKRYGGSLGVICSLVGG